MPYGATTGAIVRGEGWQSSYTQILSRKSDSDLLNCPHHGGNLGFRFVEVDGLLRSYQPPSIAIHRPLTQPLSTAKRFAPRAMITRPRRYFAAQMARCSLQGPRNRKLEGWSSVGRWTIGLGQHYTDLISRWAIG